MCGRKYGRHPICDGWHKAREKRIRKKETTGENIMYASATEGGHKTCKRETLLLQRSDSKCYVDYQIAPFLITFTAFKDIRRLIASIFKMWFCSVMQRLTSFRWRYDTIRWSIVTCAQKLTSSQLILPHETKIIKSVMKKLGHNRHGPKFGGLCLLGLHLCHCSDWVWCVWAE